MTTAAETGLHASTAAREQPVLLTRQTAGSLLRNIVWVYRRHFGVLMAGSLLPVLPFMITMKAVAADDGAKLLLFLAFLAYMVAVFASGAAMTVAISDICLGHRPTLRRACMYVVQQGRWWRILVTGLLLSLASFVGVLALLLPGLWLMARGMLSSTVVTLEGRSGWAAIKRSMALTQGQAWRTLGLTLLPLMLAYVVILLGVVLLALVGALLLGNTAAMETYIEMVSYGLTFAIFTPVFNITMVLLYYDQRVRREAYDVQALSEDLMR